MHLEYVYIHQLVFITKNAICQSGLLETYLPKTDEAGFHLTWDVASASHKVNTQVIDHGFDHRCS